MSGPPAAPLIFRAVRRAAYVVVDQRAVRDPALSWKATGLLVYLLSLPDDWSVNAVDLANRKPDGPHAVRSGLRELTAAGYLRKRVDRDALGRVAAHVVEVREHPDVPWPDDPHAGNRDMDATPERGNRDVVAPQRGFPHVGNRALRKTQPTKGLRTVTDTAAATRTGPAGSDHSTASIHAAALEQLTAAKWAALQASAEFVPSRNPAAAAAGFARTVARDWSATLAGFVDEALAAGITDPAACATVAAHRALAGGPPVVPAPPGATSTGHVPGTGTLGGTHTRGLSAVAAAALAALDEEAS